MEEKKLFVTSGDGYCYALDPQRGVFSTPQGGFLCGCPQCLKAQGFHLWRDPVRCRWFVLSGEANGFDPAAKKLVGDMVFPQELEQRLAGILDKIKSSAKIR